MRQMRRGGHSRNRGFLHHFEYVPPQKCGSYMLMLPDNWSSIFDTRSAHISSSWQDIFSNHNLGGKMSPNLRPQARSQSSLPYSTADARGYHCHFSMEGSSIRSMGKCRNCARGLGVQTGEEDCRTGCTRRPSRTGQATSNLRDMDSRMLLNKDRDLEVNDIRALHDIISHRGAERRE